MRTLAAIEVRPAALILSTESPPPSARKRLAATSPSLRDREETACPPPPTFKLQSSNPLPSNGLQISHPLKPAQVSSPAILLPVPSRGRAQGLAILLRRGCVERDRTGDAGAVLSGASSARTVKGSGAESRIVQGLVSQGRDLPVGGAVAARGEYPRWFGRPSRTAPAKTTYAERLSFAETVFSIFFRVRARTLRRPFP
jgi:hypothetical protein